MKYSNIFFTALVTLTVVYACNQPKAPQTAASADSSHVAAAGDDDSAGMCAKPGGTIMDPNNPKPMALMMRQLAANADSMKHKIERGEKLDSLQYPFIRFWLAEPTDTSVLEPQFFENARLFQMAYIDLFRHPKEPVKYHNMVISRCIGCHENYCSGPLKRIKKLVITPEG